MACSFLDTTSGAKPVEQQILDYLISLASTGMGNLMTGEILFMIKEEDAQDLINDLCSDFIFVSSIGNQVTYEYEDIEIVIYKI